MVGIVKQEESNSDHRHDLSGAIGGENGMLGMWGMTEGTELVGPGGLVGFGRIGFGKFGNGKSDGRGGTPGIVACRSWRALRATSMPENDKVMKKARATKRQLAIS